MRVTGEISSWSPAYGFIEPDDGGQPSTFFCGRSCAPHQDFMLLRAGDWVTFDVMADPRHPGRVMATRLAWTIGAEPSLAELDRRLGRKGDPSEWRRQQRERTA